MALFAEEGKQTTHGRQDNMDEFQPLISLGNVVQKLIWYDNPLVGMWGWGGINLWLGRRSRISHWPKLLHAVVEAKISPRPRSLKTTAVVLLQLKVAHATHTTQATQNISLDTGKHKQTQCNSHNLIMQLYNNVIRNSLITMHHNTTQRSSFHMSERRRPMPYIH